MKMIPYNYLEIEIYKQNRGTILQFVKKNITFSSNNLLERGKIIVYSMTF